MDVAQAQIEVVPAVVAGFPPGDWQAAILDHEIREMPDGFSSDVVGIVLMKGPGGAQAQGQVSPDREASTALFLRRKGAGDRIARFALRFQQPGTWRCAFKDTEKRLNGIWDAEAEGDLDTRLIHDQRENAGG